ncbi:hypothetical protein ACJO2E_02335 [Marinobacter sp. M1N3S26]|uniref:hypothetical protein n=1 Tax=Marinobacter sp. M1N3S26 TaxID=3382299 RepID=UPI00387B4573
MAANTENRANYFDHFIEDCKTKPEDEVVQRHLIDGESYFFRAHFDINEEFHFKRDIAKSLNVHIRDIVLVGSGKLGFSIKPDRPGSSLYLFKKFDHDFNEDNSKPKSDLDVAIVSGRLFDDQLVSLYDHTDCYLQSAIDPRDRNQIAKYVLKGWIVPKLLPDGYEISPEIEKTKRELERKYRREVNIGIYKSWYFFEKYHRNNIFNLSLNLMA